MRCGSRPPHFPPAREVSSTGSCPYTTHHSLVLCACASAHNGLVCSIAVATASAAVSSTVLWVSLCNSHPRHCPPTVRVGRVGGEGRRMIAGRCRMRRASACPVPASVHLSKTPPRWCAAEFALDPSPRDEPGLGVQEVPILFYNFHFCWLENSRTVLESQRKSRPTPTRRWQSPALPHPHVASASSAKSKRLRAVAVPPPPLLRPHHRAATPHRHPRLGSAAAGALKRREEMSGGARPLLSGSNADVGHPLLALRPPPRAHANVAAIVAATDPPPRLCGACRVRRGGATAGMSRFHRPLPRRSWLGRGRVARGGGRGSGRHCGGRPSAPWVTDVGKRTAAARFRARPRRVATALPLGRRWSSRSRVSP